MTNERIVISIIGMSCQHCVKSISKAIGELDGIIDSIVSLDSNSAEVEFDTTKITAAAIKNAITLEGYEVVY